MTETGSPPPRMPWWDGTATTNDDTGPCRVYAGQPAPIYTARRTTPCPTRLPAAPSSAYPLVWPGQASSAVKVAQTRLGVVANGVFGYGTRTSLLRWQRSTRVPVTGVLDKPTWARLVPAGRGSTPTAPKPPAPPAASPPSTTTSLTPYKKTVLRAGSRGAAVSALQKALGTQVDGAYGSQTATLVARLQTAARLRATGVVDAATWAAVERAAYPLLRYRGTLLQQGSRGASVTVLQRALRIGADGVFGSQTAAASHQYARLR